MFFTFCFAQEKNVLNDRLKQLDDYLAKPQQEKIHLHLDRPWYSPGDTIWFKAYTVAGGSHQISTISGVLYVELINSKDSILKRSILPMSPGICWGDIPLPNTYRRGVYRLRAYTNWMRNDSAYLYTKKILIGALPTSLALRPAEPGLSKVTAGPGVAIVWDIQFLPEGGELINGIRSKIAFKALNKDGSFADFKGIILNAADNEITTFTTQHLGTGAFWLRPQKGIQYKAKITLANGHTFFTNLPISKDVGFSLSVADKKDSIAIRIATNAGNYKTIKNTPFYILAQCGGRAYFSATGKMVDTAVTIPLAKSIFPTGIIQITLFSGTGEPLNERLVFVQNKDQVRFELSLKKVYKPFEQVQLAIATINNLAKPLQGSYSVAVTDETSVPVDETVEQTILTDLLLSGDLSGRIEKPNYYFENADESTAANLDLLMLTQGFRKFIWKPLSANITQPGFLPEKGLALGGILTTTANKPITGGMVRITSIRDHFAIDTTSDENGKFSFNDLDLPDTTKVIVTALTETGSNNLQIAFNKRGYASVAPGQDESYSFNSDISSPLFAAMTQAYQNSRADSLKNTTRMLAEVKVTGKRKRPNEPVYSSNIQFSSNLNGPGKANQVILGDRLKGCPILSQCLSTTIFGVIFKTDNAGTLNVYSLRAAGRHIIGEHPMAIFVGPTQIGAESLKNYSGDDVYSVEVLTSVSYLSIYGSDAPNGAIIITLKTGAEKIYGPIRLSKGIITYNYTGYSKIREFYSPVYNDTTALTGQDNRKTIYWNPNIITDVNGKASVSFFNGAKSGRYRLVIEGIDGYGNLGRHIVRYKVE